MSSNAYTDTPAEALGPVGGMTAGGAELVRAAVPEFAAVVGVAAWSARPAPACSSPP